MKKLLLICAVVTSMMSGYAQKRQIWRIANVEHIQNVDKIRTESYAENERFYSCDTSILKSLLQNVPDKFSGQSGVVVEFPNAKGTVEKFQVWENSNFAPELQAKFPEIRAFSGIGLDDKTARINFSLSPLGVQTMVFRADQGSEFMEAYTRDRSIYILFDSQTRKASKTPFHCGTVEERLSQDILDEGVVLSRADNQTYKTMRLALSCTGEYGVYFGGTVAGALAAMNATMTRVNGVFEKDMALHLNLIPNNDVIVYLNGATDPYTGINSWNSQLQSTLTAVIGEENYDIGHVFGSTGGGGSAGCIGCVCDSGKGSGKTAPSDGVPAGDTFDIDYVIHEMGHQLGANHTFSHNTEGSGVNVEPGSGSTIMGYAGITSYDVQSNSDAYFTYRSILQMQNNLNTKTCPVSTPIANTPPEVNAGADFAIPAGTAFWLDAVVSDAEGDVLTYCWEQNNSAGTTTSGANSVASPTKTTGPNFRSFLPKSTSRRVMPDMAKVLAGTLSTQWESVSTVTRTSKYTLTVRDNNSAGPQTNTDEVTVTTRAPYNATSAPTGVGPFVVTSQNSTGIAWPQGSAQTITWDVNNTTSLPGSENVNIKLSLDGGQTFSYILAENTPNDGVEVITVPEVPASQTCRILIEPTNNVYFAVNGKAFYIGYEIINTCNTYSVTTPFAIPDGSNSYTVRQINVPTSGVISDVNFTVNATHPNLQNLVMALIRPGGSISTYYNQQCTGSADMNVTFDAQGGVLTCASPTEGTYKPTSFNLDTFNGLNPQGNWQFGFKDIVAGNAGTINSISLEVCSQSVQLSTNSLFEKTDFMIYPNPNDGHFTIQFGDKIPASLTAEIIDLSGRSIYKRHFSGINGNVELEMYNASPGLYFVSVRDGSKKKVEKIYIK